MTKKEKAEITRLIRQQWKDMKSSHTVIEYQGRKKTFQPNYKSGDDKEIAIELENFILRTEDGNDKVENNK